jgi:hypothetical protein
MNPLLAVNRELQQPRATASNHDLVVVNARNGFGGGGRRAPQQKLRTHRSLEAYCVTLWWRWIVFPSFRVMEHRWNEIYRGKPTYSGKNVSQCHFVHHKSHMDWPRDRTRASAMGGRRIIAWAKARPWEMDYWSLKIFSLKQIMLFTYYNEINYCHTLRCTKYLT